MPQRPRSRLSFPLGVLSLAAGLASAADADHARGDWTWEISASQIEQGDADLDDGGEVGISRSALAVGARRDAGDFGFGASFRYQRERWDFSDPIAFGGVAPWKDIQRASVGVQLRARLNDRWQFVAAPTVQYSGEKDADSGDAMSYGAALAFVRSYGDDLRVGFGAAVLRDIGETKVRPLLSVNWKIDEHWRLGTPESVAPAGLAGIELGYRRDARWDFGLGLGFGEYRFRLDEDGPTAGGIGEARSLPLYARASYRPNALVRFDAYAGATLDGRVRVEYGDARGNVGEDYGTAPMLGIAVTISP